LNQITPKDLGLGNHVTTLNSLPNTVINVLFGVAGGLAIIFIIIGGIKYVVSAGDSKATASAKNTILYAVVGLVVVAVAGFIVNFILKNFNL
jgi:hypothetical protein